MILSGRKTLTRFFLKRIQLSPRKNSIGYIKNGKLQFMNFKEYKRTVEKYSSIMKKSGLHKQDKVAIISRSGYRWHLFDISIICLGGIVIPINPETPHLQFIIEHSECSILIVDNYKTLEKIKTLSKFPFHLKTIIVDNSHDLLRKNNSSVKIISLKEITQSISEKDYYNIFQDHGNEIEESDIASIVYTDTVLDEPKGVVISHEAIVTMLNNTAIAMEKAIGTEDRSLLFSPLFKIKGRSHSFLIFPLGIEMVYPDPSEMFLGNIVKVNPTVIMGDPNYLKKIYSYSTKKINKDTNIEKKILKWALKVSDKYYFKIESELSPSTKEIFEKTIAYKIFFSKIFEKFGGKIRFFISDGISIASEIIRFFRHANLIILEGHGLTETIGFFAMNPPGKQLPETVGLPMGDTRFKISQNGKLYIKTKALFSCYYKNPQDTAKALIDNYFYSEKYGKIMANGYLKIIENEKNI